MANTRISTASDGTQSDDFSETPVYSPDGTKVAFASYATNLVSGDTNGSEDIFLKDLATGTITRISTDAAGREAGSGSSHPVFSADGTKVAFSSNATNLAADDTNARSDIFVKDLGTGTITRVSTASDGTQGNGNVDAIAAFSSDGNRIVFSSNSTNLVANDTNGATDIFVKDLRSGAVTRVSTATDGTQGNRSSGGPAVFSPDGTKVAFVSQSTNLFPGDINNGQDIIIKDLASGSVTVAGGNADGDASEPVFSPDGTMIAFSSTAALGQFPFDTNGKQDVFVQDLASGVITRVSTAADGSEGNGDSFNPVFSPDGTKIAFLSGASNLAPGDTNRSLDAFVKNLGTGEITRLPMGLNGAETNGATQNLAFSPDGTKLVVTSNASNLVTGDTNRNTDIFVVDVPCFRTGTLIRTERGEVAIEDLRVGDLAVTASGAQRPITWIGHRDLDAGRALLPFAQRPIRVHRGAFGLDLPERDLFLSPGHPVLVGANVDNEDGVLVPIMCLTNGTSIRREPASRVTYWHVQLDVHDILLAEGLPAESYIDLGSRQWFGGAEGALYDPDMMAPGMPGRCRPVAIDGPVVEAERRRLDQMFATRLAAAAAWPVAADALAI